MAGQDAAGAGILATAGEAALGVAGVGTASQRGQPPDWASRAALTATRAGQGFRAEGPAGARDPFAAAAGPIQRQRGLQDQPPEPQRPRAPERGALVRSAEE